MSDEQSRRRVDGALVKLAELSPAERLELLLEMWAPQVVKVCKTCGHRTAERRPGEGLIDEPTFRRLVDVT